MFASSLRTKRDLKEQVPGLEVCLLLYVLNAPSFFLAWQVWPLEAVRATNSFTNFSGHCVSNPVNLELDLIFISSLKHSYFVC